jgi:hypothetical protein
LWFLRRCARRWLIPVEIEGKTMAGSRAVIALLPVTVFVAAVAGAVVGATVATAAESSNTAAATTNAYDAGVAVGSAQAAGTYAMGALYPTLPSGCVEPTVKGVAYYLCGNTWFQPTYGANGVYYKVVAAP